MPVSLQQYTKRKDYLICVDSDGCAIDTMEVKHKRCFGPCMVAEWLLDPWRNDVLKRWNEINLYSMTRGINRFMGLTTALEEINQLYTKIEGISELRRWVEETEALSNSALETEIKRNDTIILKKALNWSMAVNAAIRAIPWETKKVFGGVKQGIQAAREFADIAVVSSANRDATVEEWEKLSLLGSVDLVLCQEIGSKPRCISELKKKGFSEDHVLMVGDAPGDKVAADMNGVYFFPILVRQETESWYEFPKALQHFRRGSYKEYGYLKSRQFIINLAGEEL